jgi:hypothetical protein
MATKSYSDHFLQLRIPKYSVADIDKVISAIAQLKGLSRCAFIRHAVCYALASISPEVDPRIAR